MVSRVFRIFYGKPNGSYTVELSVFSNRVLETKPRYIHTSARTKKTESWGGCRRPRHSRPEPLGPLRQNQGARIYLQTRFTQRPRVKVKKEPPGSSLSRWVVFENASLARTHIPRESERERETSFDAPTAREGRRYRLVLLLVLIFLLFFVQKRGGAGLCGGAVVLALAGRDARRPTPPSNVL